MAPMARLRPQKYPSIFNIESLQTTIGRAFMPTSQAGSLRFIGQML
jgi:hypothetical protein